MGKRLHRPNSKEVTHHYDDNTGRYMQVVTPALLRRILDEDGSDYSPSVHFAPNDEWDIGEDEPVA